jgi:hypothetical protein
MQWPEPPTPSRAWRAPNARPTKGGAVRTRIALATAVAVNVVAVPAVLMSLFNGDPASAQATRHEAVSSHRVDETRDGVRLDDKLMSYSQARKVAKEVTYAAAVQAAQQATFYNDVAWFQAVAAQENTIPAAWMPTAICEEGGSNNAYAGYFGILEWNGFDGYPTAGSAPAAVQLAWEAAHGQGPPDAPGECHGY